MPYSARMQQSHLYSVFFAPRGLTRMADLGMQIGQQYLSPFDKLIGIIGEAGSGKSMLVKGMFPGLELTNDDEGVNVRPLPILHLDTGAFYSPHTYHLDIRFESAFTQMWQLKDAILGAINAGKRVVVEHFDLIYPILGVNAHLLIGVGSEIIVTRPNMFGPEPQDIADSVFHTIHDRKMAHSAEDLCGHILESHGINRFAHRDVKHGFILVFDEKPNIDLMALEMDANAAIQMNLPISYVDDKHISIGEDLYHCTGPRMHIGSTGEIKNFALLHEFMEDPITKEYYLVGVVSSRGELRANDLNRIHVED
ncbi:MAG: alanine-tRNA synthetase second additional domain-containing protein [Oscillospiraceae bacterium]|nr:alanine-tRNA synthetase second additional domain-containing protein [Oscillospiraceae bacterium]